MVLGSAEGLAFAELSALSPRSSLKRLSGPCVLLENDRLDPASLRDTAGGIVKIATVVPGVHDVSAQSLTDILLAANKDTPTIIFGISRYDGAPVDNSLLHDIKSLIEQGGKRARYVASKDGDLSSVVIQKQGIQELIIAKSDEGMVIGITEVVQDFESWGKRDYGRPNASPKSGMLPPKVARMAVNLAVGAEGEGKVILDPFCGMGTILAEGLMRRCRVVGSDISEEVVLKAQKNLDWLVSVHRYIEVSHMQLFVSDATHISEKIPPLSVDAVVTEPFMGTAALGEKRVTDPTKIRGIVKGLEKLYIGCLKDWARVLKSGGKVVMAIPEFVIGGKTYSVKRIVDNCENLGYSKEQGPIEYSRPQAVVKREFYVFRKN